MSLVNHSQLMMLVLPFVNLLHVNVKPFHEYGSRLSHIVIAVVLVTSGFTVKFNVASESQPADDVSVAVCEPAAETLNHSMSMGVGYHIS